MSLARNPNVRYSVAGRQALPFEKMHVCSHVYVPAADACADCDGQPVYAPPAARRQAYHVTMKTVVILAAAAIFVLSMLYISAVAKRASVYKTGQRLYDEIQEMDRQAVMLQAKIEEAQASNNLRYQASQRLGMINSEGVQPIEIEAPMTRPLQTENSLSASSRIPLGN